MDNYIRLLHWSGMENKDPNWYIMGFSSMFVSFVSVCVSNLKRKFDVMSSNYQFPLFWSAPVTLWSIWVSLCVCGHCLDTSRHFCGLFLFSRSLLDVLGLSLVDLLSHPSVVTSEKCLQNKSIFSKNNLNSKISLERV